MNFKKNLKNELLNHNNVYITLVLIVNYVSTDAFSFFVSGRICEQPTDSRPSRSNPTDKCLTKVLHDNRVERRHNTLALDA